MATSVWIFSGLLTVVFSDLFLFATNFGTAKQIIGQQNSKSLELRR